jgi:hypothetical protein
LPGGIILQGVLLLQGAMRFYPEGHVIMKNFQFELKEEGPSKYDFRPKLQNFTEL